MDQTTARLLNRTKGGWQLSEPIRAVDADRPRGSLSAFEVSLVAAMDAEGGQGTQCHADAAAQKAQSLPTACPM